MQLQAAVSVAVAESIELAKPTDAALEDSVSPLLIHIGFAVAGQRGDHPHPLIRQKLSQVVLSRFGQDREIAAVDHVDAIGSHLADQRSKSRMQLWGSAGEIKAADALNPHHLRDQLHQGIRHHLRPPRSGIHVTVAAALIAAVAEVHLQGVQPAALQGRERLGTGSQGKQHPQQGLIFSDRATRSDGH